MEIDFKNKKLAKQLNSAKNMSVQRAKLLKTRMARLEAAVSLADLWPPYSGAARCHELKGNHAGQFSVDLDHPYRLLFVPDHTPLPMRPEGGLDWSGVTAIIIIGIENTHE